MSISRNPEMPYPFEKLEVWKLATGLVKRVYRMAAGLPRTEMFGLGDQLRRSAISVGLNIAEGRGADSDAEFRRYLGIALKSLVEVIAGAKLALELEMANKADAAGLFSACDELEAKLRKLRMRLAPKVQHKP
jgi:four helix bundle protein